MPLYEYGCEKCGQVVEKLQSSPDAPAPQECPKCGAKDSMSRLISNTSFQLKGSGWYVTDYGGSTASSNSTESSTSSASDSASTSETTGSSTTSED